VGSEKSGVRGEKGEGKRQKMNIEHRKGEGGEARRLGG